MLYITVIHPNCSLTSLFSILLKLSGHTYLFVALQAHQVCFQVRALTLAVPSAWNVHQPQSPLDHFFTYFHLLSEVFPEHLIKTASVFPILFLFFIFPWNLIFQVVCFLPLKYQVLEGRLDITVYFMLLYPNVSNTAWHKGIQ